MVVQIIGLKGYGLGSLYRYGSIRVKKVYSLVRIYIAYCPLGLAVPLAADPITLTSDIKEGERLARTYCATCHAFPEPELLPRNSWNFLLTYMGMRLGVTDLSQFEEASAEERSMINARKLLLELSQAIPPQPLVEEAEWHSIRDYYLERAPEWSIPQGLKSQIENANELFSVKPHRYRIPSAVTSMVHIDSNNRQLLIGDSRAAKVTALDSELNWVIDYPAKNSMWLRALPIENGIYLLSIGDISGDLVGTRAGNIFYGERLGDMYLTKGVALDNLYRPTDMGFADFDGNGQIEVVVTNFGIEKGSVSIYESISDGVVFDSNPVATLYEGSGAVKCDTFDFDSDGRMDIAVLVSDADEHFSIYMNQGDFAFDEKRIIESHSAFGYTTFQLVDFDLDGDMDLITVNGDSVDADPYNTLKAYHGIRVYINEGDLEFSERYFYPMYGAYGVEAHDFDLDGDIDIAAYAFNPDFNLEKPENFIFLEQIELFVFTPRMHSSTRDGRWLTMDAGDLDGDGDVDIALGAGYVPAGLSVNHIDLLKELMEEGPSLLFLENRTIK